MHREERSKTHLYQDYDQVSDISTEALRYEDFARFRLLMEYQVKMEVEQIKFD